MSAARKQRPAKGAAPVSAAIAWLMRARMWSADEGQMPSAALETTADEFSETVGRLQVLTMQVDPNHVGADESMRGPWKEIEETIAELHRLVASTRWTAQDFKKHETDEGIAGLVARRTLAARITRDAS
jgi:hypothetical protein